MSVTPDPGESDGAPRWWEVGKEPYDDEEPQGVPVAPGIHLTITPTPTAPQETPSQQRDRERRARIRRWLAVNGAAAGVGWTFGLYDAISAGLTASGNGGAAMGLALAGMYWLAADIALSRYGRFVPHRLRPAAAWALRIPFATALLATAIYAPRALI
ncbi:MAG: hypothetical protein K0R62_6316 [Nonomuraea muscovyensis]|jgi:hypothetical protein|nr:hypothetical protein [Nonomuraea muscovyensis]